MIDWAKTGAGRLVLMAIALLVVVLAEELHRHLSAAPVKLPFLLFELLEAVLLVGCAASCVLLILRVRAAQMAVASTAMLAVLLLGESWFAAGPVTLSMLLVEMLEVVLVVGATIACALVLRPSRVRR